jgi:hypothetical protein
MPELLLAAKTSDWIAIGSAIIAAGSLAVAVFAVRTARSANELAAESLKRQFDEPITFSGERIKRFEKYIEIHTRFVNDSEHAVRVVEVKLELEDESRDPFVAKRHKRAPTADHPVVVREHVPRDIRARQGRVFHVRWNPDAVTLDQRVRAAFRTDTDTTLHAGWHKIPAAAGS